MSMRSTRAHCILLARRNTLCAIYSFLLLHTIAYYSRKVHASVLTQATLLAAALDCHTLAYGCLWSPRSRRVHAYHAERNHKIPSQFERQVQDTPTCENPSKGLFYNGPEI